MKRNPSQPLNTPVNSPADKEIPGKTSENKSPYLKAILNGFNKSNSTESDLPVINSDRLAALRYIKESAFVKKLFFDKMSC